MTIDKKPYFMSDPSWYEYSEKERKYVLTDSAPSLARQSYQEFYDLLENGEGDPNAEDQSNDEIERIKKSMGL
jgi:hypothetical protein